MNRASLTPRTVDLAGLSLCLAVIAAFHFLAAGPLVSQSLDARSASQSVKAEKDQINRLTASLRQTRLAANMTTEKLRRFGDSLQRADSVNDRISALVELAKSLGLQLAETTPGAPRPGKEYDAIPVRLGGRGTLAAIASFLDTLHGKQSDVAIETLDIRAGTAGSRENNAGVEFSLLLTSYVEHAAPDARDAHDAQPEHDAQDGQSTSPAPAGPAAGNAGAPSPPTN
ncbi:MAG: type 4a pilus biogenesis protein PilO [Phycisphaerales bacterium]